MMNQLFAGMLGLLLLVSLIVDRRMSKAMSPAGRRVRSIAYLLTIILLACYQLQISVWMPADFFVNVVSPRVYSFIQARL